MALNIASVRDSFAKNENRTIKILVAGPPGSGKTRSASTWPNPIYADAEGRLLSIRDRDVLAADIRSIKDLEELKIMLDQDGAVRARMFGRPVDSVIIDTVDEVAKLVVKERMRSEKVDQMRMQDWGYLAETMRNLLRGFRNLSDVNVVFNVHLKSSEDSETGRVFIKPDIPGSIGNEIAGYVDESFLLVARPAKDAKDNRIIVRHMQTYPDAQHDWVKDHSGAMPLEFVVNFNDDYERMAKLIFGGPVITAPAEVKITTSKDLADDLDEIDLRTPTPVKKAAAKKAAAKVVPAPAVADPDPEPELPPAAVTTPEPESSEIEAITEDPAVPEVGTEIVDDDPLADLGTEAEAPGPNCSVCGVAVPPDYSEYARVRYGIDLCREHLAARQKRR